VSTVPKLPRGKKRPGDVVGNAVKTASVARDGEEPQELETDRVRRAATELGSRGGKARAARMTPERRTEIAQTAAAKRWNKPPRAE
jgi:hypothetical protein